MAANNSPSSSRGRRSRSRAVSSSRSEPGMGSRRGKSAFSAISALQGQDGHEGLLGDLHIADPLETLLARLLLLQELALARDVAAVALGDHVLAERRHRLAGDDLAADRRLDRHLEHLPRDQALELLDKLSALGCG